MYSELRVTKLIKHYKKEKGDKIMDFTTMNGNYSKNLKNGAELITEWYEDKTVSVQQYAQNIRDLIASAYISVKAKPRFEAALDKAKTKDAIVFLCYNSILAGSRLTVI